MWSECAWYPRSVDLGLDPSQGTLSAATQLLPRSCSRTGQLCQPIPVTTCWTALLLGCWPTALAEPVVSRGISHGQAVPPTSLQSPVFPLFFCVLAKYL